ncbi:MAG: hypothetical protein ABJB40_09675, partial [Acidobacteriota bacterium]
MKRCPECRRDYYDDTLLYCLDDGNALLEGPASAEESPTAILPAADAPSEANTRAQVHTTDALPAGTNRSYRTIVPLIAVVMLLCLFFGYKYFSTHSTRQIESVAVMPFANDGGDSEVEYLSDGMTESLIASLSQLPGLSVKARSSVFRYKGKDIDPKTI